jgi:hypothetical protein
MRVNINERRLRQNILDNGVNLRRPQHLSVVRNWPCLHGNGCTSTSLDFSEFSHIPANFRSQFPTESTVRLGYNLRATLGDSNAPALDARPSVHDSFGPYDTRPIQIAHEVGRAHRL